jgi:Asp-tRNA(Asn)/Glu-tRNA(Gln) amidotransferase A subunit family amidase
MAVLGVGEETGGSIQNPAAAQALVSVKPTFGLVANTGVVPLAGSTRDVIGPIAKTVRDAALTLDVLAGYSAADPKTVASIGHVPERGYAAGLNSATLRGKRIGLYGPGWRTPALSPETQQLYAASMAEMKRQGAILVTDPFAGSDFASLAKFDSSFQYDQRGEEFVAYDLQNYLTHLGPKAAARSLAELVSLAHQDPFGEKGPLAYERLQPVFVTSLADPSVPPPLRDFLALRDHYIATFNAVMDRNKLDALIFPQSRTETPLLFSDDEITQTVTSEINIGGFPGITVPGGYYKSGSAFGLIFVGRLWDEAKLLRLAYSFEQHTRIRQTPRLVLNPAGEIPVGSGQP